MAAGAGELRAGAGRPVRAGHVGIRGDRRARGSGPDGWLDDRARRWPATVNPHLFINWYIAVRESPVGARFIYLAWGTIDDSAFSMFRRAKLQFDAIDPATLDAACRGSVIAHLELTDAKGQPPCASVRPPLIRWSTAPAG